MLRSSRELPSEPPLPVIDADHCRWRDEHDHARRRGRSHRGDATSGTDALPRELQSQSEEERRVIAQYAHRAQTTMRRRAIAIGPAAMAHEPHGEDSEQAAADADEDYEENQY